MTTKQRVDIEIKVQATVRFDQECGVWVSWCPALDIYGQGTTEDRAKQALSEALGMYVRYCYKHEILDNILRKRGFDISPATSTDAETAEREVQAYDLTVPLPLQTVRDVVLAA